MSIEDNKMTHVEVLKILRGGYDNDPAHAALTAAIAALDAVGKGVPAEIDCTMSSSDSFIADVHPSDFLAADALLGSQDESGNRRVLIIPTDAVDAVEGAT